MMVSDVLWDEGVQSCRSISRGVQVLVILVLGDVLQDAHIELSHFGFIFKVDLAFVTFAVHECQVS